MTLQDCYRVLGGDYADVIRRLRKDAMIEKFVFRFLEDQSFAVLCRAMQQKNREEAFRAAHTIKGVCQNLSFTKLQRSAENLTEALRTGWKDNAQLLFEQVEADYQQTAAAIASYQKYAKNL